MCVCVRFALSLSVVVCVFTIKIKHITAAPKNDKNIKSFSILFTHLKFSKQVQKSRKNE